MAAPVLIATALAAVLGWGHVTVTEVRFEAPGAADAERLLSTFGVEAGAPLSREAVRRGVQALMATGEVEDVEVTAESVPAGVALRVEVQVASRVRELLFEGLSRRARRFARSELGIEVGAPLRVARFEHAMARAQERLRQDGFPEAVLEPDLDFDVAGGTVAVRIVGSLGPARLVRHLDVAGVDLDEEQLWKATGLDEGDRLTVGALDGARRRLAEYLRRQGWWEAVADEPQIRGPVEDVTVSFTIRLGPPYRLDLLGIDKSKSLAVNALPFTRGDEPFSETAVDSVERRVRMFLQRQGFLLASVSGSLEMEADARVLHLVVERGRRTPVRAVRFPGAEGVDTDVLRERVGARRGHPWRWGGEPIDEETLQADATSVLVTLRELGFADAKVEDARIASEDGGVAIEFPIVEGDRYAVGRVTLTGVPAAVAAGPLPLQEGAPWSAGAEIQARDRLVADLREAGYPDAQVGVQSDCRERICDVVVEVVPGVQAEVERVVLSGLARTKPAVVEKVAGLAPGEWISPEERLLAQRRLLSLGIFRSATLRTIPGQGYGAKRGMVLDLGEAPSRALGFGIGWNTEDRLRVSAAWSELNLFGTARTLSLETTISDREQRYQLGYREPARLGLLGFPTAVAVYRSEERFADYDFLRRGMWVEFGDRQRRPRRMILRYDYQIVRNNAPEDIKSSLERDRQNIAIASITPILEWDSRDDVFSPSRGIYASLQYKSAFKLFQADVALDKVTASVAGYTPLAGGVLAVSVRAGGIDPRGGEDAGDETCDADNCLVPVAERFFSGGRVSHRAFPTDLLGIPEETLRCKDTSLTPGDEGCDLVAVGGAGLVAASAEWRVPLWGVVGGSVFVDAGNVWANWRDIGTDEVRWGAGLGLRVLTPVGPFRLEYGWKLDRKPWESRGQLFLSFGNPF